jgi:hypothetical protein
VDVVVSPVMDVLLGGYPLVKGGQELVKVGGGGRGAAARAALLLTACPHNHPRPAPAPGPDPSPLPPDLTGPAPLPRPLAPRPPPQLLRLLQPSVLVPLLNADIDQEGTLCQWMSTRGDVQAVRDVLAAAGLGGVDVDMPAPPGEAFAIAL